MGRVWTLEGGGSGRWSGWDVCGTLEGGGSSRWSGWDARGTLEGGGVVGGVDGCVWDSGGRGEW